MLPAPTDSPAPPCLLHTTQAGLGLAPVGLLFEYLAMLASAGPQRWAYDELAATAQMRFRFQASRSQVS